MNGAGYAINGIPLDTARCRVTQGSTLFAGVSASRAKISAPFRNGTIPTGLTPTFEERSVTLKVTAFGRDGTGMDSRRLARLCTTPHPVLSRTMGGQRQTAEVELASMEADDGGGVLDRVTPFTVVFAMPGVWWRDEQPMDLTVPSGTTGLLLPGTLTLPRHWTRWTGARNASPSRLADFATRWLGAGNESPSILFDRLDDGWMGDAPICDPIIRLPKGVSSAAITDPASGTGVTWAGDADATRYTYLDIADARAYRTLRDAQWDAAGMIDETGGLDYPAAGMLQCWPAPTDGAYRLTVKLAGSTDPLIVHCRRAWW